jgi:hypothetical protein
MVASIPPAGIVALAGTLATPGSSDRTASVTADGTGEESEKDTATEDPRITVCEEGPERFAATLTTCVADARPNEFAVITACPKLTPVTRGWANGVVAPAGMYTLDGFTVTNELSLERSEMKTPFTEAFASVTASGAESPGATVTPAASVISADHA